MKIRYSLFFLIVFVLGPKTWAQTTSSTPTIEDSVYQVGTLAELLWISENSSSWTSSFVLTQNIDASPTQYWDDVDAAPADGNRYNDSNDGTSTGNNEGWLPIGNLTTHFTGHFDGRNYKITDLRVRRDDSTSPVVDAIGLFGVLGDGAIVENINMASVDFAYTGLDDDTPMGALVGISTDTTVYIRNSSVNSSTITGSYCSKIGGIIGFANHTVGKISGCNVSINASGTSYVGGIVGQMSKEVDGINSCLVRGTVEATKGAVGES